MPWSRREGLIRENSRQACGRKGLRAEERLNTRSSRREVALRRPAGGLRRRPITGMKGEPALGVRHREFLDASLVVDLKEIAKLMSRFSKLIKA